MVQQGQVFRLKATRADGEALWAYRYRVAGRGSARFQVGGFSTRAEAQRALQKKLARVGASGRTTTITLAELVEEYLQTHTGERVTIAKLRWLLGKATAAFGDVRLADLSPEAICAWRLTAPEGHRYEATQALRQVLNRAVAWKLIDDNPAKRGVPNPGRRCREQRPFDSWEQIRAVAELLGPAYGPMVLFAAATGLRPSELFALEHGDVDRRAGVVQIRRAYANGRVKQTKTRLSRRAVPLQAIALEALEQLRSRQDSPLLFPNSRGGYLDFRNFNRRQWKPVQKALGIDPLRDLYDLRHTYATFALRAGVPVFAVSRFMGTSIAMIDLHYGHLAVDSFEHAVSLLDALALERAVDARWTSRRHLVVSTANESS
ncbi:MAG: tyrosine-type recombinase/integrase [Gaiellales bacterium]